MPAGRAGDVDLEVQRYLEDGRDHWRRSRVQSLLFSRDQWTQAGARRWALEHGFRASKVHQTQGYVRIRQVTPRRDRPKRQVEFGRGLGIYAVVEAA